MAKLTLAAGTNDSLDLRIRKSWNEGSLCQIYSRSKKCWTNGKIINVFHDSEGEWLKVRYNETHCKHIQRLCQDIKPTLIQIKHFKQNNTKYISLKNINYTNMSLLSYCEKKKIFSEIIICGYLRQLHINNNLIPSIIINLCLQSFYKNITINEFNIKRTLGKGTFGTVRLCEHNQTTKEYAIKILNKKQIIEMKQENNVLNECKILEEISHPFIIKLLLSFSDINYYYLIFELLPFGCEFFDLLQTYNRLNITQSIFYSSQIVLIFEYLHSKGIIYRDLKPENLMYNCDGYLKLIDFGFSTQINTNNNNNNGNKTYTLCGTPDYLSPEMILNKGYSYGIDWWSLGILIYEMYNGYTPFESDNVVTIYTNIINHNDENQLNIFENTHIDMKYNRNLVDIICRLLCKNPKKRLGNNSGNNDCYDIKTHPFFSIIDWNKIRCKQYKNTPKHSPINKPIKNPYPSYPIAENNNNSHQRTHLSAIVDEEPFLYDF